MSRVDEFREMLLRLLPPGELFSGDPDSNIAKLLEVFAAELARLESGAEFLVKDLDPTMTTLFLADYERVLGLPDCDELPESTVQRRGLIAEKLNRKGNLTADFIEAAAALIGETATVTESAVVDHQFIVDVPDVTIQLFRVGESRVGDSLGSFGTEVLECLIDKIKPAWTTYVITTP